MKYLKHRVRVPGMVTCVGKGCFCDAADYFEITEGPIPSPLPC